MKSVKKCRYSESKHKKHIEHIKSLISKIYDIKERYNELHNADIEKYGLVTAWSKEMYWKLEDKNRKKIAKEFRIAQGDIEDILVRDPFDWLAQNVDITMEEYRSIKW